MLNTFDLFIWHCNIYLEHLPNKTQIKPKQKPNQLKRMIYEKRILRGLEKDLKKHKIKAKAIADAAKDKGKTTELVRLVLKGDTPDFNDIVVYLDKYLKKHIKNLTKVSNKIGKY